MGNFRMHYKDGGAVPDSVGLLISILLRYPEVGTIHYLQEEYSLRLAFLIRNQGDMEGLEKEISSSLEVFNKLEGRSMRICRIEYRKDEEVCVLTITRDVDSMTQTEVGLIVELVKQRFLNQLVSEEYDLPEEELLFQEELIGHMLSTIKNTDIDKNVVAVREEGKVLLYKN